MSNSNYNIVEVVHTYDSVITTDSSIKLSKLWAGFYYVVEKLFPIHVKLHKIHDNKLIFNKVHVNRLKRSCLQSGLIDAQPPPPDIKSCEPATSDKCELSPRDVNNIIHVSNVSNKVTTEINDISVLNDTNQEQISSSQTITNNSNRTHAQTDIKLYIIEKI